MNLYSHIFIAIISSFFVASALPMNKDPDLLENLTIKLDIPTPKIGRVTRKINKFNPIKDIIFRVYTRLNPSKGQIIKLNDTDSLRASNFNSEQATRFLIHGWSADDGAQSNVAPRLAYLNRSEFNVITVDWGVGAKVDYAAARNNLIDVGKVAVAFIDFLVELGNLKLSTVAIIGHSLGAHAAGITGKNVKSGKIPYIVGLDPARSLFSLERPDERISVTDAEYVEIIHTNIGDIGFEKPLGHVSFYPSYGNKQPGCTHSGCDHARSVLYHAESITSKVGFWASQCGNGYADIVNRSCQRTGFVQIMGGEPPNAIMCYGVFYLNVNDESPFARGCADL